LNGRHQSSMTSLPSGNVVCENVPVICKCFLSEHNQGCQPSSLGKWSLKCVQIVFLVLFYVQQLAIEDMHFGFMKGKESTDAIFIMRQMQEKFEPIVCVWKRSRRKNVKNTKAWSKIM